jgi:hypothetical protein
MELVQRVCLRIDFKPDNLKQEIIDAARQ